MRLVFVLVSGFIVSLLTACQHFNPADTVRQEKFINIAIVNSESYMFIPNAHCIINTDTNDGDIETKLNPDAILLTADYRRLALDCDAPGYKQNAIAITNTLNHWAANDLFILPGNVVDLTSSLLPYYPSHVLVLMSKQPFVSPETRAKNYEHAKKDNLLYQGTVG
ncbi:MAG: hypothetical protein V4496_00820 [Pseudomonadota bacterium]